MSRWYLVLGLTVALFEGVSTERNCTENCALCYNGCLTCKQGYYKIDGKCEKCNPNCMTCYSFGMCYFECKDGWYGLKCVHACSCSYGTCDKYTGSCPQTDPPDWSSNDHHDYDDDDSDVYIGKVLGMLALPLGMVVICCCCMKKKRNSDEEQVADDTTDIIPPSQKLIPGQTPITTRSTNITYPNFFAGNSVMGPPQGRDFAPSPCTTYRGQQTDIATPSCSAYRGQQTVSAPPSCPTFSGQQTDPARPRSPTYGGQRTDPALSPCATYSGQQTDPALPPCPTYSGQQTDIGLPPAYTARTNMPPPPSYESLFDSKKEHSQEPFT